MSRMLYQLSYAAIENVKIYIARFCSACQEHCCCGVESNFQAQLLMKTAVQEMTF
ncbi:MAG: hypothetical protein IJR50_08635 [Treponema sp.]|nr:hypothetical protein [Treponema sp.]